MHGNMNVKCLPVFGDLLQSNK